MIIYIHIHTLLILFYLIDSKGKILNNIYNEIGEGDVKYFYYDIPSVAKSMKRVINSEKFS